MSPLKGPRVAIELAPSNSPVRKGSFIDYDIRAGAGRASSQSTPSLRGTGGGGRGESLLFA
jgi:hypothetical protein